MSVLSWGKPKIEIAPYVNGALPPTPTWTEIGIEVKEGTAQLSTEQGAKTEALDEGGNVVDVRFNRNRYTFTFSLFVKKGASKPIADADGVVNNFYALRLTPEDADAKGFQLPKCTVTVEETWASADGGLWTYTFAALKPESGNALQRWPAESPFLYVFKEMNSIDDMYNSLDYFFETGKAPASVSAITKENTGVNVQGQVYAPIFKGKLHDGIEQFSLITPQFYELSFEQNSESEEEEYHCSSAEDVMTLFFNLDSLPENISDLFPDGSEDEAKEAAFLLLEGSVSGEDTIYVCTDGSPDGEPFAATKSGEDYVLEGRLEGTPFTITIESDGSVHDH